MPHLDINSTNSSVLISGGRPVEKTRNTRQEKGRENKQFTGEKLSCLLKIFWQTWNIDVCVFIFVNTEPSYEQNTKYYHEVRHKMTFIHYHLVAFVTIPGSAFLFSPFCLTSLDGASDESALEVWVGFPGSCFSGGFLFKTGSAGLLLLTAALFESEPPSCVKP